jgi:DNA (cytosine-5)-methyltransferase 1
MKHGIDNLTCIDLFAGCGGLSLGLKQAGWSGVFAIERDRMAFETFSRNFLETGAPYSGFTGWPEWLSKTNHDITSLLSDEDFRTHLKAISGSVTLMAGGPPCQGFSIGGRRDGADERNTLPYHMLDMVGLVKPKIVLIENVEGIIRRFVARPGEACSSVADNLIYLLGTIGYKAFYTVLDSSLFGVPQTRRRVIIIGIRECSLDIDHLREAFTDMLCQSSALVRGRLGLEEDRKVTAYEALDDLCGGETVTCPDSDKFESSVYKPATSAYSRTLRREIGDGTIPDSHRYSKHGQRIQTLYNLAHQTQAPGRLAKRFLRENGTKKDKKVLIDASSPVSTITTHPDEFIHYAEPRNITVREMARLQSFPDDFHFLGRYTINGPRRRHDVARCSQVGNAVPPLMAEGIGLAIRELLQSLILDTIPQTPRKSHATQLVLKEILPSRIAA